jgi:hypothetical protein
MILDIQGKEALNACAYMNAALPTNKQTNKQANKCIICQSVAPLRAE